MRKIYLQNLIEEYPLSSMDKSIKRSIVSHWNIQSQNKEGRLIKPPIDLNSLPNTYTINDYLHSKNLIISTILEDEENIKQQIVGLNKENRISTELVIENTFDSDGRLTKLQRTNNQQLEWSITYAYDKSNNLIASYVYSRDNSIVTDKSIYSYKNNFLIKVASYSDNGSGAGPTTLVEEEQFEYNAKDELISNFANKKFDSNYLADRGVEFICTINDKFDNQVQKITKTYSKEKELVGVKYSVDRIYKFERKYDNRGNQIELISYYNNQISSIAKTEIDYI